MKRYALLLFALLASVACSSPAVKEDGVHPQWTKGTTVYEMNVRQITPQGTFSAAAEVLPLLRENGVDIIWLMPIHPIGVLERKGTLGSYYAVRDYKAVNPEFGTIEDFDNFLSRAHGMGFKVILDWVANHTSPDSKWAEEHPEWFLRNPDGSFVVQHDWTDITPLDLTNREMMAAMRDCLRFWLDRGVDGFRCDVAGEMPVEYWQEQISILRKEYPGKYWLAEGEKPELHTAGFDASYSWELHHMLNTLDEGTLSADTLASYINRNTERYGKDAYRLTFITNHDENSWAGTEYERLGDAWKAAAVLCWTLPGSQPLMYTGQLGGMHKRLQFFEKDSTGCGFWNSTNDFYKSLNDLYHAHKALQAGAGGDYEILSTAGNTLSFRRWCGSDTVTVKVQLSAPWNFEITASSDCLAHIEPPCWWVGMKTSLQLMLQGPGLGSCTVEFRDAPGIKVSAIHKAESPDYLFADVEISPSAAPGTYMLEFRGPQGNFSVPYQILAREDGSAQRKSFGTADAIYLLMPDRFSNGDPTNDNTPCTAEKADSKAFFGRHGGDIKGIADHLDYIAGLGMTAIWLNPALLDNEPEASYHGYACADYYRIDPRFGSNESYRQMVRLAHERGLKIIMDIVTNHCGAAHWWMQNLPFGDWIHQWPEYTHSNCAFSAQNDPYCPNIDKENMQGGWFDTSMPDMNLDNPYVLQYFKQWAVWWIEWAGLDGLRVDTYPYNEKEPMSQWCKAVREEYPNINIVGEVWSENVPQVAYWQDDNPNKDGFDSNLPSIMDFPLYGAICRGINADKTNWDEGMQKIYDSVADDLYFNDVENMMIFPGNHDTDRIADIVDGDISRLKIVMTLMATLRGYPQIYSGDELAVRSLDRSQGHGGLRVDFDDNWLNDPARRELYDYFCTIFNWRKTSEAVQNGKTMHFLERNNTYAYFRYTPDDVVFTFINNNPHDVKIPWEKYQEFTVTLPSGQWQNVVTDSIVNTKNLTINEKSALVLHFVPSGSVQRQ